MTINLNQPPYFDDFDSTKNYTKIVCVPGRVEQAREMTQIQTMQQDQIESLFDTIYTDGKVVSGCILTVNITKTVASISPGKLYAYGRMWTFTTAASVPITGVGTEIIGVVLQEVIITENDDPTLLDPAAGYTNYMQPGAHRLRQTMLWTLITDTGLGVFTLIDGALPTGSTPDPKPAPESDNVLDIIARRDYERYGNYLIEGLTVSCLNHPTDQWNKKRVVVKAGVASLRGYDTTLYQDWYDELSLARDTNTITGEAWAFSTRNTLTQTGGERQLSENPVAVVNSVIATVLAVDGYGDRVYVTRGSVVGGTDSLSELNVVDIIAVNQGGTWNPATEAFTGGTTYSSSAYVVSGNGISWSPLGAEPNGGTTYSVAYRYRKTLTLEIVQMTGVTNEARAHNDSGGDIVSHPYTCEINDYTDLTVTGSDTSGGTAKYIYGTDFVFDEGTVDWYIHEIQIIEVTKGTANGTDALTGFTDSFTMGEIITVGYYSNPAEMSFDEASLTFVTPDATYTDTTDWVSTTGVAQISWSPGGSEPSQSATYFVAVRARKYMTTNHPTAAATYYLNYSYWNVITPGDYLARNSFYISYYGPGDVRNVPQVYGLNLQNYVNFWRSYNFINNSYNMDKPYPSRDITFNYEYYLPRFVIVRFDATNGVSLVYGNSSTKPQEPTADLNDMSVDLSLIYCPADSLYVNNQNYDIQSLKVKELHKMLNRTDLLEQQISQTWLDLQAKSLPVPNKKGIMTLSFTTNDKIDPGFPGTTYSIDPDWQQLALPHTDSFASTTIDPDSSTIQQYKTIATLVPNGSNYVEQPFYTGDESIAPYALAAQTALQDAQNASMSLSPSSDTLIIPRTAVFSGLSDANAWAASDIKKLSNPTQWFSNGWTGGWGTRTFGNAYVYDFSIQTTSDVQTETWTSNYIRDIPGNCRQITVAWSVAGGLLPTADAALDYFIYFGGVLLTPTLTNGTPAGSAPNSFRPTASRGASGTFVIPPNIPEGRIEVKIQSTVMAINGNDWRQIVISTFDAAVVEQLTMQFTQCRCNCYCNCWCNCYNCRGRCGTGPLAETLEPIGRKRFLKSVDIDFSRVHPTYGVFACIIKTDNGQPTSNTVSTGMIARQLLSAAQLAGAGLKEFIFDDPVYQEDSAYAIVITGEDVFNLHSIAEVAASRDIRCKIATLGQIDIPTGKVVGSQPFKAGILWRSLTGVTWEQDQKADLKFKATYYEYPVNQEQVAYLQPIAVVDATAFLCTWNSTQVDGTSIVFEYRTSTGLWTEFTPYQLTFMSEVTDIIYARARILTTMSNVTPFVENFASFYIQSSGTSLLAVTNLFDAGATCDTLDIWVDSFLPSGASQALSISFDGTTWTDLDDPVDGNPDGNLVEITQVNANVDNVTFRYHWTVTLGSPNVFTAFKVKVSGEVIGNQAQLKDPRFSNLIAIAS